MKRFLLVLLLIGLLVVPIMASTQLNYTASEGGVFNGGFELGSGSASSTGPIGLSQYGWLTSIAAGASTASYSATEHHTGSQSLKLNVSSTGLTYIITDLDSTSVMVKGSTTYEYSAWVKTDSSGVSMGANENGGSSHWVTATPSAGWTQYTQTFTTAPSTTSIRIIMYTGVVSTTYFDDITLEEVVTDTQANSYVVKPIIQGVTSTDNIDQSLDSGWAAANTYALTNAVNEGATHIQTFTPTKNHITNISIYCVATGTAVTWTLAVHDASNNVLSSNTFTPVVGVNSIPVPALWASGNLHFHVYASATTGTPTLKAASSNNLETGSYIEYYAKNTESASITVNGVNLNVSTNDATGLLSGAKVDLDKGFYNYTSGFLISPTPIQAFANNVYSASFGSSTGAPVINGWEGQGIVGVNRLYPTSGGTTPAYITLKVNTILPITHLTISTSEWQEEAVDKLLQVSADNVAWTTLWTWNNATDAYYPTVVDYNGLNGNTTFYVRHYKESGATYEPGIYYLNINATLNTSSLSGITQTVVPGTNTYLFSSNGQANSSSLDPSLQMNVWLMGTTISPTANFVGTPLTGKSPTTVSFVDMSTGTFSNWNWTFGDGSTSTSQNPDHTYTTSGSFNVNLTVGGIAGSSYLLRSNYVNILPSNLVFFNTTGNSSWIAPYGVTSIHLLVVGGGGGGAAPAGGTGGGGGGAGGVVDTTYSVVPGTTYNVYVATGGSGGATTGATPTRGLNSTFNNASVGTIAYGGGVGTTVAVINGSSGGGGLTTHGYALYGSQGNDGYQTGQTSSPYTAGGGGGAGGASTSQEGGTGYNILWLTGNNTPFAAGGGGGTYNGANTASASGIGGIGAKNTGQTSGVANTGSGGGGYGGTNTASGGSGGTGTVIIGYDTPALSAAFTTNFTQPAVSPPAKQILFTDQSSGSPTAWSWSFRNTTGNNTVVQFATTENPVYSFGVGNFSIALNASTSIAYALSTQNMWINISALADKPIPSFTSTTATGIVPLTVTFTDTTINYPTSWKWDFAGGTGSDSTLQNPTYTFNTVGTYSINFTATSAAGSNSTIFTNYVTVNPMVASFTANNTYAPVPMSVGFTGSSTGTPNTWYWEFGDGTNSTLQNPSHIYTVTGIYNVNFKATNTSSGAFDWENKTAYINAFVLTPVADFVGVPVTGTVPTLVTFTDLTTNAPTSWNWSLGDGYVSSSRNVTHVYNTAGTYTVNLTANNTQGSNSMVKTNYITINPMVASFSADHTTGAFSVVAQFTGSSTGTPNTWYWDLGDGNTSTLQNPLHTYSTVGTYDVKMKATNTSSGAFDWENKTGYIVVTGYQAPVASFTISASDSYVPMTVVFGDTSTNNPYQWLWNFGDGNTSALQNPTFVYRVPGSYTVTLNATNAIGSNVSSFSYIRVSAIPLAPTVNFSWSNTAGITLPVTVQFTDHSTQSPTSWYWSDFGDGSGQTSLLQNPTHVYNNVGAFPVTLSVTNVNGTPSQTTKYVQVTSTTGGVTSTKTTVGTQTIETLSGSGSYAWTCPSGVYSLQFLLIGGGASGTNGGMTTGYTVKAFDATGGKKGETSSGTIATIPGSVYQFVVGPGGVTNGATSISSIKVPDVFYDATRYTVTNGAGNGGYTYAFGSTANGGIGGLSTGVDGSWNVNGVTGTGTNGIVSSVSGTYVTYGGDGSGYALLGGVQGGGNGYNYLGGPSTPGAFYGAGGGAGDNSNGVSNIGSAGANGAIILNYQQSSVILPPVSNFTGTPTSGSVPLTVQFTDLSTNGPTSWSWSFGDGGTSTEKNPSYTYNTPGSYTVALTDYNSNTTASGNFVRTNYINASAVVTPTPAPQSSTTWYVPRTITMHVVNSASNQITGAQVAAVYNSSTLPGGVTELIAFYGMNQQAANDATNGTLIMSGTTDSNGDVVFTMLSTLKYDLTVTYAGTTNSFSIHPQDSYYQLRFLESTAADTDISTCLYANGNTHISASQPDPYNFTMSWSYQDTCGLTTALDYYVFKDIQNAQPQMIYTYHLTPITSGIYVNNYTVPNVRGVEYRWYENFTRSV